MATRARRQRVCPNCRKRSLEEESLKKGKRSFYGETLLQAARYGHIGCMKASLAAGADVNYTVKFKDFSSCGTTSLIYAVRHGHIRCVKLLLEKGAKTDIKSSLSYSALGEAAKYGDLELMEILIAKGADVNIEYLFGTALTAAVEGNYMDCVKLLLEKGADVNKRGEYAFKESPIFYVRSPQCLDLLLQAGADAWVKNEKDQTPFAKVKERGDMECVEILRRHFYANQ